MSEQKPRLRYRHFVWSCRTFRLPTKFGQSAWVIGYGYSPRVAYDDWKRQQ